MVVKLLTEHHLEFLSLKGGYRGSSKSTHVKLLEISCTGSYDSQLVCEIVCSVHQFRNEINIRQLSSEPQL